MNKSSNIHLEKVTGENVDELLKLRTTKEQGEFVASNQQSIVDAYLSLADGKPVFPFGIYNGKTPVGFLMIDYRNDWSGYRHEAWLGSDEYKFYQGKHFYYLWRFMIDRKFQKRGYGRKALKLALEFARTNPCGEAEYCVLSYDPKNEVAKKLYFSLSFAEINGPGYYEDGDEISAVLKL